MKFSNELFKSVAGVRQEPPWLLGLREKAWEKFEQLRDPIPQDEEWKYTPLNQFKLDDFDFGGATQTGATPFDFKPLLIQGSGNIVQNQTKKMNASLDPTIEKSGVFWGGIQEALQRYPSKLEPLLKEALKISDSKFQNLHHALEQGGNILYVPKGTEVERPFYNLTLLEKGSAFPFLLIVVESHAKVALIDEMISVLDSHEPQFVSCDRFFWVHPEARLDYTHVQQCHKNISLYEHQYARVMQDAIFQSVHVGMGAKCAKSKIHTALEAPGAQAQVLGVFFGDERGQFDHYTIQEHRAEHTQSDLLFKSVLKDEAQANYQGVIEIPKVAQHSEAFQANRNLLLSEHAKARSIPKLEIIADDVQCKHAATMSTLDAEEAFYLESRGLSPNDAEQIMTEGFFEQVLTKIPSEEVRMRLQNTVHAKLMRGGTNA
ncbi:MAG: Fe-S cluster assembly protein SufD [Deltaproteobacteria bacterium]|nr:Fe-S cluster assembly protein SufD [Deltaproteobacteria bacterium]